MKIVINNCYGGFSLSPLAVKRMAELKGKECYFFKQNFSTSLEEEKFIPITLEEAEKEILFFAYSVPNPDEYKLNIPDEDGMYKSANERAKTISLDNRPDDRTDKDLVAVVEELKEKANSRFSKLKIIEIPDGIDWEIEEYDGQEWVSEKHRSWC